MPRPLRLDYPGATHHVFVRGVARGLVALDDSDFEHSLLMLARTVARFEITCHAWCHLPNHSHFLVTSELGNLSRAMQWLGTCTAQTFNRRYDRPGHLYQGRFGSRLVADDYHLLELARYLPLNPVRAGLCRSPEEWPWSSYAATAGLRTPPWFLNPNVFMDSFETTARYTSWVAAGVRDSQLDEHGSPVPPSRPSLETLLPYGSDRAIGLAHFEHGYSQAEIARFLGVSKSQIGRRLTK
jgi:putative transposase